MERSDGSRVSDFPAGEPLDKSGRGGSSVLALLLAVLLVLALAASFYLSDDGRAQFVLWFLATLAALGVLGLFMLAIGALQVTGQASRNDLTKIISDAASDAFLVTDVEGRVIYANLQYLALAGGAEGAVVRPIERLFTGAADVSEAVYRLAQASRERRRHSEEIRMSPGLDGQASAAWYRIRVRPVSRAGRHESLWSITDITLDRRGEEGAVQELQNAINFLDHAPAGFFSVEPNGRIAYMNATLSSWLDLDIAEHPSGLGLSLGQIVAAGAVPLLGGGVAGAAGQVKTEVIDIDLRKRGGQALPVRLFHRISYGHDGQPGASRTIVLNRSVGGDASDARAAEVKFARFFHNSPLAIATIGRNGEVIGANAPFARLIGDSMRLGDGRRSIAEAVIEKDRAALMATLSAVLSGQGEAPPLEVGLAGGQRFVRAYLSPVADREDSGEAAVIYLLDTTEQRSLQEQFTQAQKMQAVGQLAGGVAHDFNNVLTAIIGYSDLLIASHRPTDPSYQDIMQIKQNANRAASLVRQLLAFSRRQTLRPQLMNLNDNVSDLQILLKRLLGEKVELDVAYGRDLWPVKADVNQFEQVVVNLAVNARDAMEDRGRLTLRTANISASQCDGFGYTGLIPADYVLLEVEDTGCGMTTEVMEKIFEPFFTTKEIGKGTGLGLSMVFGIVKQSGGFIYCDSVVGRGTIFRVFLPRHVPSAEEAAVKVEEQKAETGDLTGQGTILLVEDEEAVRAFGARALRSRGYTVLEASSGVEALEHVEEHGDEIALVVSDVVMPEMDGPTLFIELKKLGRNYAFVFASGYAEEAFKKNLPDAEQESFAFLPKPYSLKQLIEAVKQVRG